MFDKKTISEIAGHLFRDHHSIAVAESVTAGYLQAAFASAENATAFFQGGLTAYNIQQKYTQLHIDITHAINCNAVSEQVAAEMALGVNKTFSSDWAIGITGYAAVIPQSMEELYACYAIAFKNDILITATLLATATDPFQVQVEYVDMVLKHFLQLLTSRPV